MWEGEGVEGVESRARARARPLSPSKLTLPPLSPLLSSPSPPSSPCSFDRFNLKYNPFGQSRLREVFIKQDNLIRGRFLAELTREVFNDLEASKYQHAEYRVSVYGRKRVEWATLAAWVAQHGL